MYKNQKRYFSKPIIPPEVIEKSMVKIRTQQKPKKSKIKSKTKVIIKQKTKKQKEIEKEKLLKLYGKNNNLISLLIYLLKRRDEKIPKSKYKRKGTYGRGGYKKGKQYQTRMEVDKERLKEKKDIDKKKTFNKLAKIAEEAKKEPSDVLKAKKLKEAEDIANQYLTDLDYEKYSKFLTEEERRPQAILGIKKAIEEESKREFRISS